MISKTVERWLDEMWALGASDLHLAVGAPPQIRVDGSLRAVSTGATRLGPADIVRHATALIGRDAAKLDSVGTFDFGLTWGSRARLRGNLFKERDNLAVALRLGRLPVSVVPPAKWQAAAGPALVALATCRTPPR